tara:strand:+ start:392 stop:682 length:291 start_codon:yes stop_codon:yes gene_type:complete
MAHTRTHDPRQVGHGIDLANQIDLLPTPTASQPGGTAEQHLARKQNMGDGANRTSVTDLRMALEHEQQRLAGTPTPSPAGKPSLDDPPPTLPTTAD